MYKAIYMGLGFRGDSVVSVSTFYRDNVSLTPVSNKF